MRKPHRREVLALGATAAGTLLGGALLKRPRASAHAAAPVRRAIPSACWQCVGRCPIVGTVEDGRLVKIDGNPEALSTRGRICAKGQAGVNQLDNPDRLLTPLLRTGARGDGKWRRISWEEALHLLVEGGDVAGRKVRGLRALRDAGTPEKFLFHFGRSVGSDREILEGYFLAAYGTGTIATHDSICMAARDVAGELSGGPPPFADFARAATILAFGNSVLEAGVDHNATAQRVIEAVARGARLVTFDPRLSNTAAKSAEWVPLKPGTDLAVLLAMCHAIVEAGLFDRAIFEEQTNATVAEIAAHLSAATPEWAERISGVPAGKIRSLAVDYATKGPGICLSARGAFMHHNGVQAQRAVHLLQALTGNLAPDVRKASVQWKYPFPAPEPPSRKLPIIDGTPGRYARPLDGVSHEMLRLIDEGPHRPEIYMVFCHNPVYSNGDCAANTRILSDETKVPFLVAVDVTLSESSMLADLVLPDATYLERFTCDGKTTHEGVAEYQIRQPMHAPLGEARNFVDVACEIADRLGLGLGFRSAEEFVRAACDATPGVREAGGFAYMKAHGVWCDPVIPDPKPAKAPMAIRSETLEKAGFPALPTWVEAPAHAAMRDDQLVLVTYKVNVQTQSRTQNCKWLSELYHENRAWLHPRTAAARGLSDGDRAVVRSEVGELVIRVKVTEGIHPGAVAISHHGGHWAHGVYASGRATPFHRDDADGPLRWWTEHGSHVNRIIPLRGDPIAGAMCWNDTVVTVSPA